MTIERTTAASVQQSALQALQKVAEDAGMTVQTAGGTIAGVSVTLKFTFTDANPAAKQSEEERINGELRLLGLTAKVGDEFRGLNGYRYRIVDTALNRPKFPIVGERIPDGKRFKFTTSTIRVNTIGATTNA